MRKSVSDQAVQPQKIEAWNFRFSKKRTTYGVKIKVLISCAVTAQLICVFVFACADFYFSGPAAHIRFEPCHEKTGILPMQKQRRRSAPLFSLLG